MSPYRQPPEKVIEPGPRWGATPWVKFWVAHPRLEAAVFWAIILFVVVPIRIVAWPFTGQHPLDF